jgi:hypothetical protein
MRTVRSLLTAVALVAVTALGGCGSDRGDADRRSEVEAKGAEVMPFDLDRTTHRFGKTDSGGVQTVVSDDGDAAQTDLIRGHLRQEADRFGRGDFADPRRIHGDDMPGLAALRAGAGRVTIAYRDVTAGGEITYTTEDPALVSALHAWFDAQVSDHGRHAEHG